MQKSMKRLLSLILVLSLFFSHSMPVLATDENADAQDPTISESIEETVNDSSNAEKANDPVADVQALIDALPESVTSENVEEVREKLSDIDKAKQDLTDEQLDSLNMERYAAAAKALADLDDTTSTNDALPENTEEVDTLSTLNEDENDNSGAGEGDVVYVAQLDGKQYKTLQSAIDEINEIYTSRNGEILLLADTVESIIIPSGHDITLYLNDHKLTNEAGKDTITVLLGGTLVIGYRPNAGSFSDSWRGIVDNVSHQKAAIVNNGSVILQCGEYTRSAEAGTVDNANGNSYYNILNHGNMTIDIGNVSVSSSGAFSSLIENGYNNSSSDSRDSYVEGVNQANPKLTINGGTFSGGINTIKNDVGAEVIISGGTFLNFTQSVIFNRNKANITGGTFIVPPDMNVNAKAVDNQDGGEMIITGGTFVGTINNSAESKLSISGGDFNEDANINAYVADGFKTVCTEEDGRIKVVKYNAASIGKVNYSSLHAAIAAAKNGDTITLLEDIEECVDIPSEMSVTLDLNGHVLSNNGADHTINNNGTLSIAGGSNSKIVINSGGNQAIYNSGTVEFVDKCSVEISRSEGTGSVINIASNAKMTIAEDTNVRIVAQDIPVYVSGELTLAGGSIISEKSYGIYALDGGTVTVTGGTVESGYAALAGNNTTGDMNFYISGGTLTAKKGPAIYMPGQCNLNISDGVLNGGISLRMGQVNISGGTINATTSSIDSPAEYYNYSGNAWLPDALYVFGGTYTSENEEYGNSLNINITGGTFNCTNGQGSAVAIYDIAKVGQSAVITISGNAVLNTNAENRQAYQVLSLGDIGVNTPADGYGNAEFADQVNTAISGGAFSTPVSQEYCANGYAPTIEPVDSMYTVVKDAKFYARTLTLDGKIGINYYIDMSDVPEEERPQYIMKFTFYNGDKEVVQNVAFDADENNSFDGKVYYRFTCLVDSRQMTEEVTAQLFKGDTAVSKVYTYSVKTYADKMIANESSAAIKELMVAMLNFGACSQLYFNYNTGNLANAGLESVDYREVTIPVDYKGSTDGTRLEGLSNLQATLVLDSETSIRYYFKIDSTHSIDDYQFNAEGIGELKPDEYKGNAISGVTHYVEISGIASNKLDNLYKLTITSGSSSYEVKYGVLTYAYNISNNASASDAIKNLVKAMYVYNQKANAYFGD